MDNKLLYQRILESFQYLPRSKDEFFRQLWYEKRLRFDGAEGRTDEIDLHCAQLICAALAQRRSLALVLPDHAARRMPLLFITGLIMHTIDNLGKSQSHRVVYLGTNSTIKGYLSQTYIHDQKLSDIFSQAHLGHSIKTQGSISSSLPYVIFSYIQTNAERVLEIYNPQWVFLDCGDGISTDWIFPLIQRLAEKQIIGIACVQNPLSGVLNMFQKQNWNVFSWATANSQQVDQTEITPFVIRSESAVAHAERFQSALRTLTGCSQQINSRLQKDAWRAVGRFVRGLENLLVPLRFFEVESKQYWGIRPIHTLEQTARRFIEAIEPDYVSKALQKVMLEITPVYEELVEHKPPLWLALEQITIDPPGADRPTILVFQNRAYKQLFSLAMLAENNIAEHELQALNVWLVSLKQFAQWQSRMENFDKDNIEVEDIPTELKNNRILWHPILVGVPTKYNYALYAHLLHTSQMGIILMPHQVHLATWHFEQWIANFDKTLPQNLGVLRQFVSNPSVSIPFTTDIAPLNRIIISPGQEIIVDDKAEDVKTRMATLFKLAPRAEELAHLIDEFSAQIEANPITDTATENTGDHLPPLETDLIEKAIRIQFREQYEVIFNPDDRVQLIVEMQGKRDLQERGVRSIRPGDKVLFINGQNRQNLYDLIVARVHGHPSFALHISVIERWQDELSTCFKKSRMPLSTILSHMQARGSQLQTETAIRFWLWAQVMCPNDPNDLQRIADILDMPFVKQYYPQINRAARRLRGIHRSLSRRLNAWLEQEAFSTTSQSFNDIIDDELGLDFKDFQSAMMILTVESITEQRGLFLVSDLGQLIAIH